MTICTQNLTRTKVEVVLLKQKKNNNKHLISNAVNFALVRFQNTKILAKTFGDREVHALMP